MAGKLPSYERLSTKKTLYKKATQILMMIKKPKRYEKARIKCLELLKLY